MKKYRVYLPILFLIYHIQAMEMVIKQYTDEDYCRVALYLNATKNKINETEQKRREKFLNRDHKNVSGVKKYLHTIEEDAKNAFEFIKNIPELTFAQLTEKIKTFDEKMNQMMICIAQKNVFVFVAFSKDFFTAILHNSLPQSYQDNNGLFNPKFNTGVHIKENNSKTEKMDKTILRDKMIEIIQDKPIIEALSMLRYVEQLGIITLISRLEPCKDDDSSGLNRVTYVRGKNYYFSYEELKKMTTEQENILQSIVEKSNAATAPSAGDVIDFSYINQCFKFTDDIVKKLIPIKDIPKNNQLFEDALITIDITESTWIEKQIDKFLLKFPFLCVMIIPDLIYGKTTGFWSVVTGFIATNIGCFIGGHYGALDLCDSGCRKLRPWFGFYNCGIVKKGWEFVVINTLHYISTAIAQKFLSWQALPLKIIGGGIHFIRLLLSLWFLNSKKNYNHPLKRPNAQGKPFKFGDLLNGPKFNTIK